MTPEAMLGLARLYGAAVWGIESADIQIVGAFLRIDAPPRSPVNWDTISVWHTDDPLDVDVLRAEIDRAASALGYKRREATL